MNDQYSDIEVIEEFARLVWLGAKFVWFVVLGAFALGLVTGLLERI